MTGQIAVTGHPLTGTGVIGQTVFDLATGELVSGHGRDVGNFVDPVCGHLGA